MRYDGGDCDAGAIGQNLPDKPISCRPAAYDDRFGADASGILGVQDLPGSVPDAAEACKIKTDEVPKVAVHRQPGDHSPRVRVGEWGAVAKEFRDNMKGTDKGGDGAWRSHRFGLAEQPVAQAFSRRLGLARGTV